MFINVGYRYNGLHGLLCLPCFSVNQKWSKKRFPPWPCPHLFSLRENIHFWAWPWVCSSCHLTPPQGAADTAVKSDWIKPPVIINCRRQKTGSKTEKSLRKRVWQEQRRARMRSCQQTSLRHTQLCSLPDDSKALRGKLDLNYKAPGLSRYGGRYVPSFTNLNCFRVPWCFQPITWSWRLQNTAVPLILTVMCLCPITRIKEVVGSWRNDWILFSGFPRGNRQDSKTGLLFLRILHMECQGKERQYRAMQREEKTRCYRCWSKRRSFPTQGKGET